MNKHYISDLDEPTNAELGIKPSWTLDRILGAVLIAIGICFALGLMLYAKTADAQTPRAAVITFTKPTEYTDGTPIAASTTLTYNVYQGAKGSTSKAKVATITATATTINSGLLPGETCWQVSVVANGVESALSNEACKTFAWPAAETVTITVT
jgi:hypothetical protein